MTSNIPIELSSDEEEEEATRPQSRIRRTRERSTRSDNGDAAAPSWQPNMADVQQAAAERRLLGLNRRAVQINANGQCLWEAIGSELVRINHRLFPARARNLGIQVQWHIAEHVNVLDEKEWRRLYSHDDRYSKENYVVRLKDPRNFVGRDHWGTLDDIRMAASWLQASIYTYENSNGCYTCVNGQGIRIGIHPENILAMDIVLYNSGGGHWMPTTIEQG